MVSILKKMFSKMSNKGNAIMNQGVSIILGLFVIAILVFALAIAAANMQASTTNTTAIAVIANFSAGLLQLASFSSTWFIIAAVGILLLILL